MKCLSSVVRFKDKIHSTNPEFYQTISVHLLHLTLPSDIQFSAVEAHFLYVFGTGCMFQEIRLFTLKLVGLRPCCFLNSLYTLSTFDYLLCTVLFSAPHHNTLFFSFSFLIVSCPDFLFHFFPLCLTHSSWSLNSTT